MLRTSHSPYQMRIQTHDSTLQSRSRRARGTPTSCVKRPNASDFTEPQGTSEPTRFSSMPSSTLQARCAGANSMYEPRGSAGAGANSMYGRSPVCKSLYEGVDSGARRPPVRFVVADTPRARGCCLVTFSMRRCPSSIQPEVTSFSVVADTPRARVYVRSSRLSREVLPARLPIYVWTLGELSAKAGDSDRGADATYWIAFGRPWRLADTLSRRGSARSRPVRDPTSSLADERGGDAGRHNTTLCVPNHDM